MPAISDGSATATDKEGDGHGDVGVPVEGNAEDPLSSVLAVYEDCLDAAGFGPYQVMLLALCGATLFADATELMLLPFLEYELDNTQRQGIQKGGAQGDSYDTSAVSFWVFVGMLAGALVSGPYADVYGRRAGTIFFTLTVAVAGVASIAAPSFPVLVALRCITGFGVAGTPAPLTLYAELTPRAHRGRHLIYFMLFFSVGATVEALLAWCVAGAGVKALLAVSALPAVVAALAAMAFLPESPRYLLLRHRAPRAAKILILVARANRTLAHTEPRLQRLSKCAHSILSPAPATLQQHAPADECARPALEAGGHGAKQTGHTAVDDDQPHASAREAAPAPSARLPTPPSSVGGVLRSYAHTLSSQVSRDPQLVRRVVVFSSEFFLMAFVYYFLVMFTVKHKTTQAKTLSSGAYLSVAVSNLAEIPGLLVAMRLLDSVGRINTISVMFFTCALGTVLLALVTRAPARGSLPGAEDGDAAEAAAAATPPFPARELVQEALLFLMRASALGFNQSLWIFTTESFPTDVRASSLGFTTAFARVGGAVSPFVVDHLYTSAPTATMLLVAATAATAGIIIRKVGSDTATKGLVESSPSAAATS